jgi:hypothetical protein
MLCDEEDNNELDQEDDYFNENYPNRFVEEHYK